VLCLTNKEKTMKIHIAFDGRVMQHRQHTGVEMYAEQLFKELGQTCELRLLLPPSGSKYLQHFWEHIVLPLRLHGSELLFCPANIAPLWLPKKKKLVVTLHDTAFLAYPQSVSKVFGRYYRWLVPKNLRRADAIITVSQASKEEIERHYPDAKGKIQVIYSGLSGRFSPLPEREKNNMILYVGSLNIRKNFISLIRAFEALPESLDCRLTVVGGFSDHFELPTEVQRVLQCARENPKIAFLSNLLPEELREQYAAAKLFVFPSLYEGFGFPPLEAMASGTPVIVSERSAMPEICADAALYVDPLDSEDIARKIQTLLEDDALRSEMIDRGLQHVQQFKWSDTAKKHREVFQKVLGR
jgi:glycosyltransferase involved in cell wall biosynthesis